jgi:hypothetical protein
MAELTKMFYFLPTRSVRGEVVAGKAPTLLAVRRAG